MKITRTVSMCMIFILLTGCSNHQIFEGIKARNRALCYDLPESQREECLASPDVSYKEYERQRKEVEKSE